MVQVFCCFPIFIVFWGMFLNTNSVNLCQNSVFAKLSGCQKMRFSKRKLHLLFLSYLFLKRERIWKRAQKPYKWCFLRWSPKDEKMKKWIFSRNCLTLFVSGREKNAFSRALSVLAQNLFDPKQPKSGRTIKMVVSVETA